MNRGSAVSNGPEVDATMRFNEAPIHESGKSRAIGEASQGIAASMRPRFMNRGSISHATLLIR